MCDCPAYECIDDLQIDACADTVTLDSIVADETATWKMALEFNGVTYRKDIEVREDDPVEIPNRLNENYTHTLRLYKADGTLVNDTCYIIKTTPSIFI